MVEIKAEADEMHEIRKNFRNPYDMLRTQK
jgi:hypothetical protein